MAAGHVPVDFGGLGADLCSVSAHKFGGPKGAGALLVRRGLRLPPFVVGGAQERARRGGLEDVPAMVGFGAAAAEVSADSRLAAEAGAQRELTDHVAHDAPARVGGVTLYGDPVDRVPHLVCLGVEGVEAEPTSWGSTGAASPCTPARRARARRSSPHRSWRRWGSMPITRFESASAGARPPRTSTRSSAVELQPTLTRSE